MGPGASELDSRRRVLVTERNTMAPIVFLRGNTMGWWAIVFRSQNPICGYLFRMPRGPGCFNFDTKIQHSEHPQRSCGSSGEPNIYDVKWRHLPPVTWPVTGPSEGEHLHHDHALHRGSLSTHDEPCLCRSPHGNGLSTVPRRERTVIRARLSFSSPREGEAKSLSCRERDEVERKQLRGGKNRTQGGA